MQLIEQSSTSQPLVFLHANANGAGSITVTLSKNGAAFAAAAGTVSAIGSGYYKLSASTADTNTAGLLILQADADLYGKTFTTFQVVAFDPLAADLGVNMPRAGQSHTYTNAATGAAAVVSIS